MRRKTRFVAKPFVLALFAHFGELNVKGAFPFAALVSILFVLSCSDDVTDPRVDNPSGAAARLVVEPSSFLLTAEGETVELRVRAYDAAGRPAAVPADLSWRSLDPGTIGVQQTPDGMSIATAATSTGSAQVMVAADGFESTPALGLVASPAAGVVLIDDAQVSGTLEPIELDAPFVPGWKYRLPVSGVAVNAGDLVLATGEAPIAGRVVAATASGNGTELTIELVALPELFETLSIDESLPLIDIQDAPATLFGLGPAAAGSSPLYGAARSGMQPDFKVGPFECESTGSTPGLQLGSPSYQITPALALRFAYDGGLRELAVNGQITATFEYDPRFEAAFTGVVGCEYVVRTLVIPVGGPISLILGAQVPVGIGLDLEASLSLAEVGFDVDAEASASVELGLTCPTGGATCSGLAEVDGTGDFTFEFVSPDPDDQFRIELGAHGFAFAKLSLGSPLSRKWQFEAFEATAGLEQTVDLATAQKQAEDTAYASGFWLVARAVAGPGDDLAKAIDGFGSRLGVEIDVSALSYAVEDTLERSPTGSFEITPQMVAAGDTTELGELATFTATLDPVTFLGADVVDRVEFMWWKEDEEDESGVGDAGFSLAGAGRSNASGVGDFTLELGRPGCTDVEGGNGTTEFECETDFLEEHLGEQSFYAFTHVELFDIPLPVPLEVADDAVARVNVGGECPTPPEWAVAETGDGSFHSSTDGDWEVNEVRRNYNDVHIEAYSQAPAGLYWSPSVKLRLGMIDFIKVLPSEGWPADGLIYLQVRRAGRAQALISAGSEEWRIEHDDGQIEALYPFGLGGISADGGENPGTSVINEGDEVTSYLFRQTYDWRQIASSVRATLRTRGYERRASASVEYTVEVVGAEDSNGNPIDVQICSASGTQY